MRQRIPQSKIKDFCQPPLGKGAIGCGGEIGLRADVGIGPYGGGRSAYTDVGAGALDGPWRTDSIAGASMVQR